MQEKIDPSLGENFKKTSAGWGAGLDAAEHPRAEAGRSRVFAPLRWLGIDSYIADLRAEFSNYGARAFAADAAAGAATAAVALPLALAFGVSSGASAAAGMVTAIVAGVLIGAFSGAFYQISGPTGAMAAILVGIVAHYGLHGVFVATVLAGAILLLAGVLHLGRAISYIPMPVIIGFTSGIAVIIALGQIDAFLGTASEGSSALARLVDLLRHPQWPHWPTAALGAATLAVLLAWPRRAARYVPATLGAIVLATAAAWTLDLPVATVGEIPASLWLAERFSLADLHPNQLGGLLVPAASIAVLGMIESLLCGASAGRMAGVRLRCDRELIAQGLGNIAVPFFGGVPATAAIARTSVAIKSGARTRLAGIFHALVLLAAVFVLGPLMSRIPLCGLAAVLFVTAWRMNDWPMIRYIFARRFKGAMLKFTTTMLATIIFDLATAILVGVGLALVILITQISRLHTRKDHFAAEKMRGLTRPLPAGVKRVEVLYVMGALVFANTEQIEELGSFVPDGGAVIFSMRGTSYMDISGAAAFMQMLRRLRGRGVTVIIAGVNNEVKLMMRRAGVVAFIGSDNFYWSVEKMVEG